MALWADRRRVLITAGLAVAALLLDALAVYFAIYDVAVAIWFAVFAVVLGAMAILYGLWRERQKFRLALARFEADEARKRRAEEWQAEEARRGRARNVDDGP